MAAIEKIRLVEAHEPRWSSVWIWLTFLTAFFAVQAMMLWTIVNGFAVLAVFLVVVAAHLMHSHLVAFHEAAHGTLCPERWLNDAFGIFIGNLSFMSLSLYRAAHHSHHAYLATERDDELWPFVIPGTSRWSRRLAAAVELSLGLLFTPLLFLRSLCRKDSQIRDQKVRRRIYAEFLVMGAFWTAVLALTAWLDAWVYLVLLYLVPALLAGNMQSLRKYIEHMGLMGSSPLSSTRSVAPLRIPGRLLVFSLFNVSYHGVHHQYAKMPQTELPKFTEMLEPREPGEVPPYMNYRQAFCDMIDSLADPRVGAQWLADNPVQRGQPSNGRQFTPEPTAAS